jgi:antitoxin FitA
MGQILVRHLDDDVKLKLRTRAQRHGRSTEEEVREILREAVRDEVGGREPLGTRLARRFSGFKLDEDLPELPDQEARPADFES